MYMMQRVLFSLNNAFQYTRTKYVNIGHYSRYVFYSLYFSYPQERIFRGHIQFK
jgi:hypothetical protein